MTSSEIDADFALRRQPNTETVDRQEVRRALAGIVRDIDTLQRNAALLKVLSSRASSSDALLHRIVALRQNICVVAERFGSVVLSLPERQRSHSRVHDVRRALDNLGSSVPRDE